MATVAYHLKQALIWAVICLMAEEVMCKKDSFSKEMATKHSNLIKVFVNKSTLPGGALFRQQDSSSLPEQIRMLLAGETLKVYINILIKIRDKMQANETRDAVDYLKNEVEELRTKHFHETQKQLEVFIHKLKELQAINATDELAQRKAIYELKRVYNQVSALGAASKNPISSHRRRQLRPRSTKSRA